MMGGQLTVLRIAVEPEPRALKILRDNLDSSARKM
jgi:hypothetical protein